MKLQSLVIISDGLIDSRRLILASIVICLSGWRAARRCIESIRTRVRWNIRKNRCWPTPTDSRRATPFSLPQYSSVFYRRSRGAFSSALSLSSALSHPLGTRILLEYFMPPSPVQPPPPLSTVAVSTLEYQGSTSSASDREFCSGNWKWVVGLCRRESSRRDGASLWTLPRDG